MKEKTCQQYLRKQSELNKQNFTWSSKNTMGEMRTHDEAANINELTKKDDFQQSKVIILAQPLTKKGLGVSAKNPIRKKHLCFMSSKKTFRILKLEKVLRSGREICGITKATQEYVFMTDIEILEQSKKSEDDEVLATFSNSLEDSKYLDSSKNTAKLGI